LLKTRTSTVGNTCSYGQIQNNTLFTLLFFISMKLWMFITTLLGYTLFGKLRWPSHQLLPCGKLLFYSFFLSSVSEVPTFGGKWNGAGPLQNLDPKGTANISLLLDQNFPFASTRGEFHAQNLSFSRSSFCISKGCMQLIPTVQTVLGFYTFRL